MSLAVRPEILAFDVLGTLVDREAGLSKALAEVLGVRDAALLRRLVLEQGNAVWNLVTELEEFRPYRQVTAESLLQAAAAVGEPVEEAQAEAIAGSLPEWPLFPEVVESLALLGEGRTLALLSNLDAGDLSRVAERLGVPGAHQISADRVGCYKPEPDHLLALMHELEADEEAILVVSSHGDYDLLTANGLGIPAAYVDRRGEALPEEVEAALEVPDLARLARRLNGPRRKAGRSRPRRR